MLNKDRVILMTRMASYEAGEGKKHMAVVRFFKGDYIAVGILKAIVCGTLSFGLILGLYVYYNFESFMSNMYDMDILAFVRSILTKYAWFLGIYVLITYIVCTLKYDSSRRKLKRYFRNLTVLKKMYDKQ
jgi:hypothetical protein